MNHTNCKFRDKHTVGGIVFYKHAFLVFYYSERRFCHDMASSKISWKYTQFGMDNMSGCLNLTFDI